MINQLKAIAGILYKPKATLKALPSDKIYLLAFLTPLYFGYVRGMRNGSFAELAEITGSRWAPYAIFLAIGLAAIPLWAFVIKGIVHLCGKRLTVRKLMNLHGYAQVPRLLVSLSANIYAQFFMSDEDRVLMILGELPTWLALLGLLGVLLTLYGFFLYIYGIVISPGITNAAEQEESAPTETYLPPSPSGSNV